MTDNCDSELPSSKLGTKDFWDETFRRELQVYKETKDIGEVWFGYDSIERVVDWLVDSPVVSENCSIIDVGCGNGMMLVELAKRGFTHLVGVDYCPHAVQLAKSIAEDENVDIAYEVVDILSDTMRSSDSSLMSQQYHICLDKGTYDAVSLNPVNPTVQRTKYKENIHRLLRPNGLLIVTSCNWTQEELLQHFYPDFALVIKIPSPTFQYAGVSGNRETVLVLQRVAHDTPTSDR